MRNLDNLIFSFLTTDVQMHKGSFLFHNKEHLFEKTIDKQEQMFYNTHRIKKDLSSNGAPTPSDRSIT